MSRSQLEAVEAQTSMATHVPPDLPPACNERVDLGQHLDCARAEAAGQTHSMTKHVSSAVDRNPATSCTTLGT